MDKSLLEMVRVYYSLLSPGYYQKSHSHHFHQLDVVLEGRRETTVQDELPVDDKVGDAWLIPPLVRHGYTSRAGYRHIIFHFHLAPRFWTLFGPEVAKFRASHRLLEDIECAGLRSNKGAPLAGEQMSAVALLCLVEYLEQAAVEAPPPDNLDEFRQLLWPLLEAMAAEPHDGWTVARMAAQCNFSPDYFSRCFSRVIGWAPHHYIIETRMRAATRELLATPDRPLKEIAHRARYASVQAFTQAFRRIYNITPGAYRISQRNG